MDGFEELLESSRAFVERYVRFRLPSRQDADDVLQEVYLSAYLSFPRLKNREAFKPWIIRIAQNKCRDFYRKKAAQRELLTDEAEVAETEGSIPRASVRERVRETLETLCEKDRQILYLSYWRELPQSVIARELHIPVGTVKSRLNTARRNFRNTYPYFTAGMKGETDMKKLPEFLPPYSIEATAEAPFPIQWEELMGWFLVPREGEKLSFGMYDIPSRRCTHVCAMEVTGKASVHGIEGVELTAQESSYSGRKDRVHRTFVAQLTDTHCRFLATVIDDGEAHRYYTFLDGEDFLPNWGFGEDNCGNEIHPSVKGDIHREGNLVTGADKPFLLDIIGSYTVTINGKAYDTLCVMDIETYESGVVSEQFLDRNGRTVLWRRFNRNDWAIECYGTLWNERLPDNERLTVNGKTYVHWYDCITDYIL